MASQTPWAAPVLLSSPIETASGTRPRASPRALRQSESVVGRLPAANRSPRADRLRSTRPVMATPTETFSSSSISPGANPVAELVSAHAGPSSDLSLYPTRPLGEVTFTALKGLAFGPDGSALHRGLGAPHDLSRTPGREWAIGTTSRVEGRETATRRDWRRTAKPSPAKSSP